MARLIQKTGFISRKSAGGYMKYIATREGVEVLTGKGPTTEKQKELVAKLLKDFPDMRDSFEYEDYKQAPTLHTASALISAALDSHMQNLQSENGYLKYIATRPGAEKHGAHGLFGREENTDLTAAMHDLTAHDGNVWTIIYSLHREDAERLGYNNAAAWRKLLVSQQNKFAEAFHIPASALHWYAAYRNERYVGQIVTGIVTDERWYQETAYLEQYPDLHRPQNKPYYYVDFSERKARLIFLSSYVSQIDEQEELFEKSCQYGVEQLAWLKTEALQLPEGWAIFLFSHALPKSRFETGTDPWNYMEYASEPAMMLLRQAQKRGILHRRLVRRALRLRLRNYVLSHPIFPDRLSPPAADKIAVSERPEMHGAGLGRGNRRFMGRAAPEAESAAHLSAALWRGRRPRV